MKVKVSILDDHPLVAEGLRNALKTNSSLELMAVYNSGEALLEKIGKEMPDVLLLDIQLPGMGGDELAGLLLKRYPNLRLLILSNLDNLFYVFNLLDLGVSGYLLKSAAMEDICEAVLQAARNEKYLDPGLREKIDQYKGALKKQYAQPMMLTNREKEVLQLIAADLSSGEIAEKLFLSKRTVDTHRNSLLFKLDVKSSAGLIKKALDYGLIK